MTDTVPGAADEPDGAPRLVSLDVLRGIAILGILFMNINDMGASIVASAGDIRHLGWTGADQIAWWLRQVFANGAARCLLEMLFGAGMVILTGRLIDEADEWAAMKRYYWRNIVLFGFGLVHLLILMWPGDILHTYAIAALLIFPLRALPPRRLLEIGMIGAVLQLVGGGAGYVEGRAAAGAFDLAQQHRAAGAPLTVADREALNRRAERLKERAEVAAEDKGRTGTAVAWFRTQWHQQVERIPFEPFSVLEAFFTMLIGAALFKLGWLQGDQSAGWYARAAGLAYAVALVLRVSEAAELSSTAIMPRFAWATGEFGRLSMTLGHIFLVNRLLQGARGARLLAPFRAAGQTALTLYILQTLVTLWVLYPPWGLALYGRSGWASLMLTALAMNAVLLVLANWWVRRFRIAPVEWAWRSIVAGRRLPLRRRPSPGPLAAG